MVRRTADDEGALSPTQFIVKPEFKQHPTQMGVPKRPYRPGVDDPATYDEVRDAYLRAQFKAIQDMDTSDLEDYDVATLTAEFELWGWFGKLHSDSKDHIGADVGMAAEFAAEASEQIPASHITNEILNDEVSTTAELLGLAEEENDMLAEFENAWVVYTHSSDDEE